MQDLITMQDRVIIASLWIRLFLTDILIDFDAFWLYRL